MKQLLIILSLISLGTAQLSEGVLKKPKLREFSSTWYIPDFAKVQYGGYLGYFSVAYGYQSLYQYAQLSLHYGYTPPRIVGTDNGLHTFSFKTAVNFRTFRISDDFAWGMNIGFAFSLTYGKDIQGLILPEYYPRDYYLAVNFQVLPFLGPRLIYLTDHRTVKAVELYGEVTAVGDYLWYAISEERIRVSDALTGSLGLSFYFRKTPRKSR